jgi:hypothetical protein
VGKLRRKRKGEDCARWSEVLYALILITCFVCRQAEHYDKQSLTCGWTCLILIPAPDWHHRGVVIVRVAANGG